MNAHRLVIQYSSLHKPAILKKYYQTQLVIPDLPPYSSPPDIDPAFVLRALLVHPALPDVDMKLWNEVVQEHDEAGEPHYESYDWPARAV